MVVLLLTMWQTNRSVAKEQQRCKLSSKLCGRSSNKIGVKKETDLLCVGGCLIATTYILDAKWLQPECNRNNIYMIMNVHPAQTYSQTISQPFRPKITKRHWLVRPQFWSGNGGKLGGASGQHREWPIDLEADRRHPHPLFWANS